MATEPAAELTTAIRAKDVAGTRRVLALHPELKQALNEPMYDAHFGATALIAAVGTGNRELVDLLLDTGADINQRSHWWAGGFGVLDGDSPLVPYLIERGARVDAYSAARHGMMDRLRSLVEADPSVVRMRGGDGQTPLHVAKTVEVARYLLDHGADIEALDVDHESTPAMYQVQDHPDVARYLVSRGCRTDILLASALGDLPLVRKHLAEDPASIRLSVTPENFPMRDERAGGTIYIWTLGTNKTPHLVAHDFGHQAVFDSLRSQSPEELLLAIACEVGDEALTTRLLAGTPGLARQLTEPDQKRLPAAAVDNDLEAVRRMLAAGWPTDVRGQEGATALHWASRHGNVEMVREILRYKPDPTLRDTNYGGTALNWAQYGREHGWWPGKGDYAGTIALLRDAGVSE